MEKHLKSHLNFRLHTSHAIHFFSLKESFRSYKLFKHLNTWRLTMNIMSCISHYDLEPVHSTFTSHSKDFFVALIKMLKTLHTLVVVGSW